MENGFESPEVVLNSSYDNPNNPNNPDNPDNPDSHVQGEQKNISTEISNKNEKERENQDEKNEKIENYDFPAFLIRHPFLLNEQLYLQYYSPGKTLVWPF